jgi:YgiT-type zinc finger domain-containing protein
VNEPERPCESCGRPTKASEVYVTMWLGSELNVIEDVPAHVCDHCGLQYYDPEIEEGIRALSSAGFPDYRAVRRISVPVFSLTESSQAKNISPTSKLKEP